MRERYGIWVCPEAGCKATGRKDVVCPLHKRLLVRVVVRVERVEEPELKDPVAHAVKLVTDALAGALLGERRRKR